LENYLKSKTATTIPGQNISPLDSSAHAMLRDIRTALVRLYCDLAERDQSESKKNERKNEEKKEKEK